MESTSNKKESRIKLTPLALQDADEMFAVLSASEIYEFIPDDPPTSLEQLKKRYQSLAQGRSPDGSEIWLNWIVREIESNVAMGYVQATIFKHSLVAQIAYVLNPHYWGKGFAKEAVTQMLFILARDHRVCQFNAAIDRSNQRSLKLLEHLGFRKTGEESTKLKDGSASADIIVTLSVPTVDSLETKRVFSGAPWEKEVGYCRAIKRGNSISVSGTAPVCTDGSVFEPNNGYAQAKRCIEIIHNALTDLGANLSDVVRTRMYVTDISRWQEYGRAHAEAFGRNPPATSMIEVKSLITAGMLIEIEADAVSD